VPEAELTFPSHASACNGAGTVCANYHSFFNKAWWPLPPFQYVRHGGNVHFTRRESSLLSRLRTTFVPAGTSGAVCFEAPFPACIVIRVEAPPTSSLNVISRIQESSGATVDTTDGRKDDKVLLTAITKVDVISVWVQLIQQHKVPLAGIFSLPILSQQLLKKIAAKGTNVLLISVQSASGLRQTFFRDRQIKISRLAQMPRIGSVPYASHLMGELEKLRRYLNSLALVSRDAPLEIYILSHGQWLNELEQHCRDTAEERYYLVDVADVGARLGFRQTLTTAYADTIFAQVLLDEVARNHYASAEETHYFSLYRVRNGLIADCLSKQGLQDSAR
jgi:hypothetical protein